MSNSIITLKFTIKFHRMNIAELHSIVILTIRTFLHFQEDCFCRLRCKHPKNLQLNIFFNWHCKLHPKERLVFAGGLIQLIASFNN